MLTVRAAGQRGRTDWGWLDSRHSFSFGDYYDPQHMGFRSLRVINDDWVKPDGGFGTHGHQDMEILTYVLEGGLEHRDSMGSGSVIRPGEIQFMRAGTGVTHSEVNASKAEPVHLLQIWILPDRKGLPPTYAQKPIDLSAARNGPVLLASKDGRNGTIQIHQDVDLYLSRPEAGQKVDLPLQASRHAFVQVARGQVRVNGRDLGEGDGASLSEEGSVRLEGRTGAEVLIFDLA
jgi:redox-sensitive bicupin YhaK (pirin superfamily)